MRTRYYVTAWVSTTKTTSIGDPNGYADFHVAVEVAKAVSRFFYLGCNVEERAICPCGCGEESVHYATLFRNGEQVSA